MPKSCSDNLTIGLMSGTSLDGVDGVLAAFAADGGSPIRAIASAYIPFPDALRAELLALQTAGHNEIEREALSANALAHHYAACVEQVLARAGCSAGRISAIGVHGQTIRHRPELGYTRQTNNPALLAELTGIDVIADFRSRDIAAGGQGAPLVPAFHQAVFSQTGETRVVANIGGISNISVLGGSGNAGMLDTIGFDTGPGNMLLDAWIARHRGLPYDAAGAWAASGTVLAALLQALLREPYLAAPPPKSTGRDLFHLAWLDDKLQAFPTVAAADVQATLSAFTAASLADAIARHASGAAAVYLCGGGAYNAHLVAQLAAALQMREQDARVLSTDALGVAPTQVEALAFAWLAQRFLQRQPGNLPAVTGASGLRILGALYPH
ncbi:anhydro-N-acetylmuramic acid kinase [Herminiimonas sp. CN]|uniref:anhydro-N-acetylmuramic acid kinase n=1 Tax=Herminiimonas sp. CN TaxID=1349818 RepID=UPI00047422AF|nr:anhydro-N-acetylmuramic acid kinase [Herminiimonas sp. CN]